MIDLKFLNKLCFNLFIALLGLTVVIDLNLLKFFISSDIIFLTSMILGVSALILKEKSEKELVIGIRSNKLRTNKEDDYFLKSIPYMFLGCLLVITLNQFFSWEFISAMMTKMIILTITLGIITFWNVKIKNKKSSKVHKSRKSSKTHKSKKTFKIIEKIKEFRFTEKINSIEFGPEQFYSFIKYGFLALLLLITISSFSFGSFLKKYQLVLTIVTIVCGGLTFYHNREVIDDIENEKEQEEKAELKRGKEFNSKFKKLNWFNFDYNITSSWNKKNYLKLQHLKLIL